MSRLLIKNGTIVNEGIQQVADILIEGDVILAIGRDLQKSNLEPDEIIDATGYHILPGVIDDQVHFREPGLTHKGDIYSESRAAVAGGITSYMEMPNTNPQTTTIERLEEKYALAAEKSLANYSFYLGATNDNLEELLQVNPAEVCGIKIFMGSSTGNMLVDNINSLEAIFKNSKVLIATHCEDESTIQSNLSFYKSKYPDNAAFSIHSKVRSAESCYLSSSLAVSLAKKHNTRLHILHLSTAKEMELFSNQSTDENKRITAEVCVHHLWFHQADYEKLGWRIKWNPSIKEEEDRDALRKALAEGKIDVIATDHAPHTLQEKDRDYFSSSSGGPLVQHSLPAMLEMYHQGIYSLEFIVDKMSHSVARTFQVSQRGFIRPGYKADLAIVHLNSPWKVEQQNLLYKCGWSPFEGFTFKSKVLYTIINGNVVYSEGKVNENYRGERLKFDR